MLRPIRKQLRCPNCGELVADASYRWWLGHLGLTELDGTPIVATRGAVAIEQAERELATTDDRAGAEERLAFVRRNHLDLMFRLRCRNGHTTLRTAPVLIHAMRRTPGRWVDVP